MRDIKGMQALYSDDMTGTKPVSTFAEDGFGQPVIHLPIHPSLASWMKVDLVINPDSKVWLLHDKRFPDIVMWAEYDVDSASLTLVMRDGKTQDLGMKIHPPMRKYLRAARQLFTVLLKDEKIADTYILPLLVRETGHYKT